MSHGGDIYLGHQAVSEVGLYVDQPHPAQGRAIAVLVQLRQPGTPRGLLFHPPPPPPTPPHPQRPPNGRGKTPPRGGERLGPPGAPRDGGVRGAGVSRAPRGDPPPIEGPLGKAEQKRRAPPAT